MEEEAMGRIVVFGAGGKAGKMITDEAAQRGHSVTATVRDLSNVPAFAEGVNEITGDPTDIVSVRALAEDEDVFIVAVGGADNTVWLRAAQTLIETREAIPGPVPRILHMGGSSTLLTAQGSHCFDLPDFPEAYRGPALGQAQALDYYRGDTNGRVSWTYLSSPPVYFAPGKRTGKYRIGLDHPVEDATGRSSLSHEDFAVAMVDEVVQRRFINKGFTVGY